MQTISVTIQVSDEQLKALQQIAEQNGFASVEEKLADDCKHQARFAIREQKDRELYGKSNDSKLTELVEAVNKQTDTVSKLVTFFTATQIEEKPN